MNHNLKITVTAAELAEAFTEWDRRYREDPELFISEASRLLQETPETYGAACAPYFIAILCHLGSKAQRVSSMEEATTSPNFVLCGAQGIGKTRLCHPLAAALSATSIVDDWDGKTPLKSGELGICNDEYVLEPGGVAFHVEDEGGLRNLIEKLQRSITGV